VYPDDSTRIELSVSEPEVLLPKNSEMLRIVSIVDFDSDCEKLIIISYGLISLKFPSGMYTGIVPYVGRDLLWLSRVRRASQFHCSSSCGGELVDSLRGNGLR
jgi:hypothetical protein